MEIAAIFFILIGLGVAYVVFRILKKTVKLALRALIVLVLVVCTLVGGVALWFYNGDTTPKKKTTRTR